MALQPSVWAAKNSNNYLRKSLVVSCLQANSLALIVAIVDF